MSDNKQFLRYHPERFKLTRPYIKNAVSLYRRPGNEGFHGFTDEGFPQIINEVIKEYNSQIMKVDRLVRPQNNSELINREISLIDSYCSYEVCGSNIFHLMPGLVEEFRQTDVGGIPLGSVKFPYESFYISFGAQEDLNLNEDTRVDGAYVSILHEESIQIRITGSRIDDVDANKGSLYFLTPEGFYTLSLPRDDPEANFDDVADQAIRDEIESNMSAITQIPDLTLPNGGIVKDVSESSAEARILKLSTNFPMFRETLNILINAICYITAYRDEIESQEPDEVVKLNEQLMAVTSKKAKRRIKNRIESFAAFSTIKYCGLSLEYQKAGIAQGTSSGSKRTHWRRGHWRHQRSGAGRTLISLKWIRPMLIHPDKGTPQAGHIYLEDLPPSNSSSTTEN